MCQISRRKFSHLFSITFSPTISLQKCSRKFKIYCYKYILQTLGSLNEEDKKIGQFLGEFFFAKFWLKRRFFYRALKIRRLRGI